MDVLDNLPFSQFQGHAKFPKQDDAPPNCGKFLG